jgi:hypothetical protein
MHHAEITIDEGVYEIRADLKSPVNGGDLGVILAHGGIVNRKSLSRTGFCLAEYLCRELGAYVLTPDMMGETRVHKSRGLNFEDSVNILGISIDYLSDVLGVERIVGFGHSLGSHVLANAGVQSEGRRGLDVRGSDSTGEPGPISEVHERDPEGRLPEEHEGRRQRFLHALRRGDP